MQEFIFLDMRSSTASFKVPQVYQGFLLSLPMPPYSTILGILSNMSGREITPSDTRIGFRYTYNGQGIDLETYHRWSRNPTGTYSYNNTAVRSREIHFENRLKIVLDNLELYDELKKIKRTITFGRSQDIASIFTIGIVTGEQIESGILNGLLLKSSDINSFDLSGVFYNLPEYFDYTDGLVRVPKNIMNYFICTDQSNEIKLNNLIKINNEIYYLNSWGK